MASNREIKFRAWDGEEMRWEFSMQSDHGVNHSGDIVDWIPMQYTGLKDKNGKEVYEGDIVKCTKGCPHEVVWKQEYAGMFLGGMPAWYLSGLNVGYAWAGKEEVIGNIYENPELLTP